MSATTRGAVRDRSPAKQGIEERTDKRGRKLYRGTAYDRRSKRHLRGSWTPRLSEARSWRVDALNRVRIGTLSGQRGPTVREAVEQFLPGVRAGSIRNRSGRTYKSSAVRGYERALRERVIPAFGPVRLGELLGPEVQLWADSLSSDGLSPSSVRNTVTPLRALYGWALSRGIARVNPCASLRLPTGGKARGRIATPAEAASLIAALRPHDQAAFGLAIYAGLRLGEILALDWPAVDLEGRLLRITHGWDHGDHALIPPKSDAAVRNVPIVDRLARLLGNHAAGLGEGMLFPGRREGRPVSQNGLRNRLQRSWAAAGHDGLGFHEARHTYAALMIAAGVNAKALSTYMGHANISETFDRYGHLMPGNEDEARDLLDAYLA